jgi:hypothetical protein
MAVYAVMIRIDYDESYTKRYEETVAAIHKEAGGSAHVWEEPTSTYIFPSSKSAVDLNDAIYYGSPLLESRDLLVTVNLSAKGPGSCAQRGANYPNTLANLMLAR